MAREHYLGGREHAAIKHFFLEKYLEALCFKTLQSKRDDQPTFVYIDGFTGPWGARDTNYDDTSFGVALGVLNRVHDSLPNVKIMGVFCEARRQAFDKLNKYLSTNSGAVETKCVHGRFEDHISEIQSFIGEKGFRFAFIDPKGWKVDVSAITPLLKDSWSEVLFTFMAEFIRRFPDFEQVQEAYSSLLGNVAWKARFESMPQHMNNEDKILQIFRDVLKERWGFSHVVELPIRKVSSDRTFYKLVYGTRSPHGVLAFREAQAKAEREKFAVFFESETALGGDLFGSDEHAAKMVTKVDVGSPKNSAQLPEAIRRHLSTRDSSNFMNLAASVLENIPARESDVKTTLKTMEKMNNLTFSNADSKGAPSRKSVVRLVL